MGLSAQTQKEPPEPEWIGHVTSWVAAVRQHTPGEGDAAALSVGQKTEFDLSQATADATALLAIYRRETARRVPADSVTYKRTTLSLSDIRSLIGLSESETGPAAGNRLLMRAAILHADVAMRVLSVLGRGYGCGPARTFLAADGNRFAAGCLVFHWAIARDLLDGIGPSPGSDPAVALWYRASSAYLLEHADLANATPHLEHAQVVLPRDAGVLFEHGLLHESLAAPEVQSAIRDTRSSVRSAEANLREAREWLGAAVRADQDFAEARVHYGRVLELLGQHQEAAVELRRAQQQARATRTVYYAAMFLGDAERSLGNRDAANAHYRRAAAAAPQAQSPLVAMGFLARQSGNRKGALDALQGMLAEAREIFTELDPWWIYLRWQERDAESLFRELNRPFLAEAKRE